MFTKAKHAQMGHRTKVTKKINKASITCLNSTALK